MGSVLPTGALHSSGWKLAMESSCIGAWENWEVLKMKSEVCPEASRAEKKDSDVLWDGKGLPGAGGIRGCRTCTVSKDLVTTLFGTTSPLWVLCTL